MSPAHNLSMAERPSGVPAWLRNPSPPLTPICRSLAA